MIVFMFVPSATAFQERISFSVWGNADILNLIGTGYVGIGTNNPGSMLEVAGTIHTTSGGIKFPDNTTQTTAGDTTQWEVSGDNMYTKNSGNVGIGTATPEFKLSLDNDGGIIAKGTKNLGNILSETGGGAKLIWYPKKAAFRAGELYMNQGTFWDNDSIGDNSVAFGFNTRATGRWSFTAGSTNRASNDGSVAFGGGNVADGSYSIALGYDNLAKATGSIALGISSKALGYAAIAAGYSVTAGGWYSHGLGSHIEISGDYSVGIGDGITESAERRFFARFTNGYKFYSATGNFGVEIGPYGNSWSSISDSTKKENFKPVNGEAMLKKISAFRLGTWNYIGQDPARHRHYGPMAQDFFAAFGHDEMGVIGNDTTLSSADFDGINFIAIQALEKRTSEQKKEIDDLKAVNAKVLAENEKLRQKLAENDAVKQELAELKAMVANLMDERKKPELRMTSAAQ